MTRVRVVGVRGSRVRKVRVRGSRVREVRVRVVRALGSTRLQVDHSYRNGTNLNFRNSSTAPF